MTRREIFHEVRGAGVVLIAKRFGLTVLDWPAPGSISPCPGCHAELRGTGDRRGPIGIEREGVGFLCHRCKASGDALSLAALVLTGSAKPDKEGWTKVREAFVGTAELPRFIPRPREYKRPPLEEVQDLWSRSTSVYDSEELVPLLEERLLDPALLTDLDLCRTCAPGRLPDWAVCGNDYWNESGHLLLVPLYDHLGQMQSLHARRIGDGAPRPKGLSPLGYSIGGLTFQDPGARAVLKSAAEGEAWCKSVIITEGVPDFLTAATDLGEQTEACVMGVLSGSWLAAYASRLGPHRKIILALHEDPAGEKYASKILSTLAAGTRVTRWRYPDE